MGEETVIISSGELAEHAVLSKKRNELEFQRDFLVRKGAQPGDFHIGTINKALLEVEARLKPISAKLERVDLITFVPHRKRISEFTEKVAAFSQDDLDRAVLQKTGPAYGLMRSRAEFTRENFEHREDISRMTLLLNSVPREDAEKLLGVLEEGDEHEVDISALSDDQQGEIVVLANRFGCHVAVEGGMLLPWGKKSDSSSQKFSGEARRTVSGRPIWVSNSTVDEFDKNEQSLLAVEKKLQTINAKRQVHKSSDVEEKEFEDAQLTYIETLHKRNEFLSSMGFKDRVAELRAKK
jgi:hypothetical protein